MTSMAQRIAELRAECGLSRPALAAELHFPKNAPEKFETGRQTPTAEQQEKMAAFFGVSIFYLRGESNDRTKQESWVDMDPANFRDAPPPSAPKKAQQPRSAAGEPQAAGSTVFDSFLHSSSFQTAIRSALLEILQSSEGQKLLVDAIRRELKK